MFLLLLGEFWYISRFWFAPLSAFPQGAHSEDFFLRGVRIGKMQGPAFVGKAEITKDLTVSHQIVEDFPKRYLMARLGLHTPTQAMFDQGKILPIVITPVRDLPDGFKSQPGTPAPGLERKP